MFIPCQNILTPFIMAAFQFLSYTSLCLYTTSKLCLDTILGRSGGGLGQVQEVVGAGQVCQGPGTFYPHQPGLPCHQAAGLGHRHRHPYRQWVQVSCIPLFITCPIFSAATRFDLDSGHNSGPDAVYITVTSHRQKFLFEMLPGMILLISDLCETLVC